MIIQTFALANMSPSNCNIFYFFFLFQAKYLSWASPAQNFDSMWLASRICISIYVQLMTSDVCPQSWPKIEKIVFSWPGNKFGQDLHKPFSMVSGSPKAIFPTSDKNLKCTHCSKPKFALKNIFFWKTVFFLLLVGILLGPNVQAIQL